MTKITCGTVALLAVAALASAGEHGRVTGEYVEARTAEVFAGGCIMNSEAETAGRQALLAWRVSSGIYNGATLDGLGVVVAVVGNRNLGMREMGGEAPDAVRAIFTVDARATDSQRDALVAFAREVTNGLITEVVRVDRAPVRFASTPTHIEVSADAGVTLSVNKEMKHDPTCGAMQWFKPFAQQLTGSAMGTAEAHAYTGTGLGSKWSAPHKRSAFWGTFVY